ncbi:ABC transporter ATP-binding protein [Actibacterium sp. 188UL27-1]|uniref:ABC transporter ATP-binding protein n=1 Tax=Actibacterium sp. 188UL27-1 TaxID=2786961 RepID=UPI00195CBCC0|nr:ATP-binding cassette domain-containing protein [Actibacterium sp. 188UL27-1]MBM7069911.1 ATP-binding cassette domain-containing protein [Actibacterium sp. 188UL27-1]
MTHPLEVRDMVVTSDRGRPILAVPRFDLAAGEAAVITGPSGAGKSTLLYAIAGLVTVAEGTVRWGETELSALGDAGRTAFRRDNLGFVFQDHMLFEELSALDNSALAAAYAPRRDRAALRAGAGQMLDHLGLKREGRGTHSYSGGERQRIAVARALASDPGIILADEPTASLDRATADRLTDDLLALSARGRSLLIVSHDPVLQARIGRKVQVLDGTLAA